MAKLAERNERIVAEYRSGGETYRSLAARYGVSVSRIRQIVIEPEKEKMRAQLREQNRTARKTQRELNRNATARWRSLYRESFQ